MRKMQIFKMGSRYRVSVFSALTVYFGVDAREICANVGVQNGMRRTGGGCSSARFDLFPPLC